MRVEQAMPKESGSAETMRLICDDYEQLLADLDAEIVLLRKVADAATAVQLADSAYERIEDMFFWGVGDVDLEDKILLRDAAYAARGVLDEAVKEYRQLKEGKVDE